jgi:hypothetical protein
VWQRVFFAAHLLFICSSVEKTERGLAKPGSFIMIAGLPNTASLVISFGENIDAGVAQG